MVNIQVTITRNGVETIKQSESYVKHNLSALVTNLKAVKENVNGMLTDMIDISSGDNNTVSTSCEDDDEEDSEDGEENCDDKNTKNLKRICESKEQSIKKVKR